MRKLHLLFLVSFIILTACKKDEASSEVPSIEFSSITPTTAIAYTDEIIITIDYRDQNGDLGENDPDVSNCFITDSRNNVTYEFRIPQLSPDNSTITIDGSLEVKLQSIGISDNVETESVSFDVYVEDRAGNKSNTVTTTSITVVDN
jgi:hypothetical protein